MAALNNPIPQEWMQYVTQTAIGLEVVPAVLYDTISLASGVTGVNTLFNAVRATADLGNLQQPGMLPNPQSFLIQAIRFMVKMVPTLGTTVASNAWNDIVLLTNTGIGRLFIGEKKYGPWPLWMLSAGNQVGGPYAGSNSNFVGVMQVQGPLYALYPNLMIAPLQNFSMTMEWPAGAVTLQATEPASFILDGQLARGIQ